MVLFDTLALGGTSAKVRFMSRRSPAEIGQEITRLRHEQGLTRAALARAASISDDSLTNWEKGEFKKQPHKLAQVADALGVSVAMLINDHAAPPSIQGRSTEWYEREREWYRVHFAKQPAVRDYYIEKLDRAEDSARALARDEALLVEAYERSGRRLS